MFCKAPLPVSLSLDRSEMGNLVADIASLSCRFSQLNGIIGIGHRNRLHTVDERAKPFHMSGYESREDCATWSNFWLIARLGVTFVAGRKCVVTSNGH